MASVVSAPKRSKPRRPPPLIIPDRLTEPNVSSLPSHCYDNLTSSSSPSSSGSSSLVSPTMSITPVKLFSSSYLPGAGATRRGTRRRRNEDRIFSGGENLWGICDGHGGTEVSELASRYLSEHLQRSDDPAQIFQALSVLTNDTSGTTITAAKIMQDSILQIVHLGDSKACLIGDNNTRIVELTKDHIPSNAYESLCIKRNGGIIINGRVNGILGVTRALGNSQLNGIISITPDITNFNIRGSNHNLLILASDGFFDVIDRNELLEILNHMPNSQSVPDDLQNAAETLIQAAVDRQSTDDISVVLVDLRSISSDPPLT